MGAEGGERSQNAALTLRSEEDCPTDTACFHVQQCVEKYIKAFLTLRVIDFPKVHDLKQIIAILPGDCRIPFTVEELRRLTDYATMRRRAKA
ncbi:MAG: HEPN domain-containing protein [Nitrospirae bacterium]|nr:HEPN domain-containing protein [Nitrospirota bacterium]